MAQTKIIIGGRRGRRGGVRYAIPQFEVTLPPEQEVVRALAVAERVENKRKLRSGIDGKGDQRRISASTRKRRRWPKDGRPHVGGDTAFVATGVITSQLRIQVSGNTSTLEVVRARRRAAAILENKGWPPLGLHAKIFGKLIRRLMRKVLK